MRFFGVAPKWRKACPTANFLVRYTKKETNAEMVEGMEEARELSAAIYGRDEWWLLLDPVQEGGGSWLMSERGEGGGGEGGGRRGRQARIHVHVVSLYG